MPTVKKCFVFDQMLAGIDYERKTGVPEDVDDKAGFVVGASLKQELPFLGRSRSCGQINEKGLLMPSRRHNVWDGGWHPTAQGTFWQGAV